jgi:hypothetical protein
MLQALPRRACTGGMAAKGWFSPSRSSFWLIWIIGRLYRFCVKSFCTRACIGGTRGQEMIEMPRAAVNRRQLEGGIAASSLRAS